MWFELLDGGFEAENFYAKQDFIKLPSPIKCDAIINKKDRDVKVKKTNPNNSRYKSHVEIMKQFMNWGKVSREA